MTYTLRPYQSQAVNTMLEDLKTPKKSIVSLPTGSGKSLVIADFISRVGQPVLILQPSREILAQNKAKLSTYVNNEEIGVFSASFNLKEVKKFTFATIQSVYKKTDLFKHFNIVIIDEAHLYKTGGMFDTLLKGIGDSKVFGLTATPFKMVQEKKYDFSKRQVHIYGVLRMMTQIGFDDIIFAVSTKELTDWKYLSPLVYKTESEVAANFDLNSDKKIMADFDLILSFSGLDKIMPILKSLRDFRSTIVFCPSVNTAMRLAYCVDDVHTAFVSGETPDKERDQILKDFLSGKIRVIFNCEVLTTGFDHPGLDCIVLARPTKSLNLYNQMIGRGTRIAEGKSQCTVFDITGTSKFLGHLDEIQVMKDEKGEWNVMTSKGFVKNKIMSYYKGAI
jgi:DNA repair protein RadD